MRSWVVIACLVFLMGCDEAVDPVLESERAFTLYGYVDPGSDRQSLRVFPIEDILEVTDTTPLEARISLIGPGGTTAFADSVVRYWDGSIGHVFQARIRPAFQTTYVIEAEDARGRLTSVQVTTPAKADLTLGQADGVLGNVRMPVAFTGAEQVLSPRVFYRFESTRPPFQWTIPVIYDGSLTREGTTWSMAVDLSRDIGVLYSVTGLQPGTDPIVLLDLVVEAFIATEEWSPPGGRFVTEVLVQPGVFSNVDNGFGFVGAGYHERTSTLPEAAVLRLAGFANE
ncbi:MAG: hypothetical protein JJ896_09445 [Rhodothermales bacterium]|nr:hypothetical protein [Rhodothermales bacterium]MBO6779862.1 hypothetical protein [Rhodothermales bacterium]